MTQDQGAVDVKPVAMDTHFELHVVNKDLSCLPDSLPHSWGLFYSLTCFTVFYFKKQTKRISLCYSTVFVLTVTVLSYYSIKVRD